MRNVVRPVRAEIEIAGTGIDGGGGGVAKIRRERARGWLVSSKFRSFGGGKAEIGERGGDGGVEVMR